MFKLILFDVDGVLLSEERYFDASALTVWELLYSSNYLGLQGERFTPAPAEAEIHRIRHLVFDGDRVLDLMKTKGINSNWDMVYLSFGHQLLRLLEQIAEQATEEIRQILGEQITRESLSRLAERFQGKRLRVNFSSFLEDFSHCTVEKQGLLLYLNDLAERKLGIKTDIFSRSSVLWEICQETFQEWYLGDSLVRQSIGRDPVQKGKKGFLSDEIPIVEPKEMAKTLAGLKEMGIRLGLGTGRPTIETVIPLEQMGILPYFDPNRIVTASHVLDAENEYPDRAPLAKPQPFCYIKGILGLEASNQQCFDFPLPIEKPDEVLVVGDSVADYMAARSMGCRFAAVLTGLTGTEARGKFETLGADYICQDMREILSLVRGK